MKEFNLEQAKAGKPVCTRDGRKARIICWDRKGEYPIIALIDNDSDVFHESIEIYSMVGECRIGFTNHSDLMMAPEKHEGWVNIHKGCGIRVAEIYDTKEEAEKIGKMPPCCIATIKIEWEE